MLRCMICEQADDRVKQIGGTPRHLGMESCLVATMRRIRELEGKPPPEPAEPLVPFAVAPSVVPCIHCEGVGVYGRIRVGPFVLGGRICQRCRGTGQASHG